MAIFFLITRLNSEYAEGENKSTITSKESSKKKATELNQQHNKKHLSHYNR